MKSKYRNLFNNIGIFTIANFTTKVLSFFILPLYTYYLTTAEYGLIDLMNTIVQLFFPIFTLTIIDAVLRFSISDSDKKSEIFTIGFNVICIGFFWLSIFLAFMSFFIDDTSLLVIFLLIYFLQSLNSLYSAFSKSINRTRDMAIITTITTFSILLLNVFLIAILKKGVYGYWTSIILGNILGIILFHTVCKVHSYWIAKPDFSSIRVLLKLMLKYSIPLIPNAIFWWINSSLDRFVITSFSGIAVVGLYSCANKIPTILVTINSVFSQAWNLSLYQTYDDIEMKKFYQNVYYVYKDLLFGCTLILILSSKMLASFLFSKDFFYAWLYVPILVLGLYYNCLNGFLGSIFTASKKTNYIFFTTLIGSLVNILLNFPFAYYWSAMGASIATFISYLAVYIMRTYKIEKEFEIKVEHRNMTIELMLLGIIVTLVSLNIFWIISIVLVILLELCLVYRNRKIIKSIKLVR